MRTLKKRVTKGAFLKKDQTKSHPEGKSLLPVLVIWHDAFAQTGWEEYSEGPLECRTVGFLLRNDKKVVVLAQNYNPFSLGEYMTIPKGMVKSIKKLK